MGPFDLPDRGNPETHSDETEKRVPAKKDIGVAPCGRVRVATPPACCRAVATAVW
ncbi:MAG TPA: hypothetical protein VGS97_16230 [Actinocrinis sp.]|nr:hypothetical protein [Actinocrinis sp.]